MEYILASVLFVALYLSRPSQRNQPSKTSEFSLSEFRIRLQSGNKNATINTVRPITKPQSPQAKVLPLKPSQPCKVLEFKRPKKI